MIRRIKSTSERTSQTAHCLTCGARPSEELERTYRWWADGHAYANPGHVVQSGYVFTETFSEEFVTPEQVQGEAAEREKKDAARG